MDKEPETLDFLITQTWSALHRFELNHTDSRNVNRFEKLAKLYLSLTKAKKKNEQPIEEDEEL